LLTHLTLDQLHRLGLAGMMRAFTQLEADPRAAELTHAEWLGLLLDREMTERQDRRLKARLRFARLRHQATIEDVDYWAPRGLDRGLFQKLAQGEWIDVAQNLIIKRPTGVGKVGFLVPSATKHAATTGPSSSSACRGSSPIWRWPMVTDGIRD